MTESQRLSLIALIIIVTATMGCRQDMHDQPRLDPLEMNEFFADKRASRQLVEGTVPRGHLKIDHHFYTGKVDGELVKTFPFPVTKEVLLRGQERYNIFCSPCHDKTGSGQGMIVQRGFRAPPSYHIPRLRQEPVGHIFDVITNGLGAMYDYSDKIPPRDRWAVVAYVRVLQLSQHASMEDVPEEIQQQLLNEGE
ncbi:cytochrome c [candidate division KSB1 bacterium]|nr:cytochrome c [candidate division KSB1 bacterium]NIR71376.1 cytochrome c [candidate division KSB1 bacterium]NIS26270.1 cytochrome c [candidate division KSB1 bacterium]NIT73032.1 cytochrome c [candidate division KSB1 bacterium]NIU26940.1 cytochrome c [candidate division KSB1 bacterium]